MATSALSDELARRTYAAWIAAGRNEAAAADAEGVARTTFQARLRTAKRRMAVRGELGGPPIPDAAVPPEGFVIRRNSGQYDADGNLERQWVESGQGNSDGYAVPDGHVVKGESTLLDANGNVLVKWIKTREDGREDLTKALEAALERFTGAAPAIAVPRHSEDDLLTVYPIPDLHLGMYAWAAEAGADYDVDIAVKTATQSVAALVAQSRPARHAVLLGLGDYFHTNSGKNATPQSGHQLDVDTRWMKIKTAGAELALSLVDMIARRHQQVEVMFLPGNHDPDAAVGLTVAMAMFYRKHQRIEVNTTPAIAWYRRFGRVLLGATHGHTMKPNQMALMLAADRAEDWGQALHRHFFFGHVHHESAKEVGAVRVESFGTPAAKDAYAAAGGWRAGRSMSALTFHRTEGETGRHRVNISAARPRVRVRAA